MALRDLSYTDEEMRLILAQPLTPAVLLDSMRIGTAGLSWFGYDVIEPQFRMLIALTDKEKAVGMMFYRLIALVRTAFDLHEPYQFQSLAGATRAIFEITVDLTLLTDGTDRWVTKFHAFTRVGRFRRAQKRANFYDEHPDLEEPEDVQEDRAFLLSTGLEAELEQLSQLEWGKPLKKAPENWSGYGMDKRTEIVGSPFEELYRQHWSLLSWYMHGGGAGVGGIEFKYFSVVAVLCREIINSVVPLAYHAIGVAIHLHRALPAFFDQLDFARRYVQIIALSEARLHAQGHPGKYADLQGALRADLSTAGDTQ